MFILRLIALSLLMFAFTGTLNAGDMMDYRQKMKAAGWEPAEEGVHQTDWSKPAFPFDELIYSWSAKLEDGEGFRVYLQVKMQDESESPWLYGGYWGEVQKIEEDRKNPTFDHGTVYMDQLILKKKASEFRFSIKSTGSEELKNFPDLYVITSDNDRVAELENYGPTDRTEFESVIYDLPLRKQEDSKGNYTPDRCQSAAVASAMEYFGTSLNLEDIIAWTNDDEYDYPGIWPRTLGAATQQGFEAYIDRFRNWDRVLKTLEEGKIILCSIEFGEDIKGVEYPPYPRIGGHIVVLNGITDDGRVVITDSALGENEKGYRCQWLRKDFEKVWMLSKGGVGMVVAPPDDFEKQMIDELPEFPYEERKKIMEQAMADAE